MHKTGAPMTSFKTILITGASTGFGRDTAETLTREGHRVFASFRDITGRNKSHADALRGKDVNVVELDVTNNTSVESAVSRVLSQAGRIDVLVNNAGIASAGVSEAFTPESDRSGSGESHRRSRSWPTRQAPVGGGKSSLTARRGRSRPRRKP